MTTKPATSAYIVQGARQDLTVDDVVALRRRGIPARLIGDGPNPLAPVLEPTAVRSAEGRAARGVVVVDDSVEVEVSIGDMSGRKA